MALVASAPSWPSLIAAIVSRAMAESCTADSTCACALDRSWISAAVQRRIALVDSPWIWRVVSEPMEVMPPSLAKRR